MLRAAVTFALFGAALGAAAQEESRPKIDRALVERFRLLKPDQKDQLRKRLDAVNKLSPEERRRLHENLERFRALSKERQKALRERLEKMTPDERKQTAELATGFFRWMQAWYGEVRFPRQPFFRWVAARRPEALEELKKPTEPGPRKDAFIKLAHEYREFLLLQLRQHSRRHGCISAADVQGLEAEDFGAFWGGADRLARACPNAPKRPGQVRRP